MYKDMLGRLEAKADISIFGGTFSAPRYSLHTMIDGYPTKTWPIETSIETIVSEMEADGFACSVRRDGYNKPFIHCVHTATQKAIDTAKSAQELEFCDAEAGYVRFGACPDSGRSINHRDNTLEDGVSCFRAEFSASGKFRLILTPVLEVSYLTVMGRPTFRLYGEEIGTGADGEPLLRVSRAEAI